MTFPFVVDGSTIKDHKTWIRENEFLFRDHAAVLLRNFPIKSRDSLEEYIKTIVSEKDLLDYTGGTSPRKKLGSNVYSSTEMPFFLKIPMHSEMAYRKRFPKKIFFYCETAPLIGGQTPIADIRKVFQDVPESIRTKLLNEGIIYYRHLKNYTVARKYLGIFNPMIKMGTWQFVFKTTDSEVVNEYCRQNHYEPEWLTDGSVILKTKLPAMNQSGAWFNSFHFFQVHSRIWGRLITPIFKLIRFLSGGLDMSATTGMRNRLSDKDISLIVDAYEKNQVEFNWQEGDLLYLDNTRTAHGRNPYFGKRKILVSLAEEGEFTSV
ncbi:TauD/TfdA family dioxygenase [Peredibacter sp. HCB2-198]|uniref:TauD/TfdA family dioxygenase n=1 Tax=Peredibacter sp. HCB2-198 TaxID=3383025 RepID=UPI0038B5FD6B